MAKRERSSDFWDEKSKNVTVIADLFGSNEEAMVEFSVILLHEMIDKYCSPTTIKLLHACVDSIIKFKDEKLWPYNEISVPVAINNMLNELSNVHAYLFRNGYSDECVIDTYEYRGEDSVMTEIARFAIVYDNKNNPRAALRNVLYEYSMHEGERMRRQYREDYIYSHWKFYVIGDTKECGDAGYAGLCVGIARCLFELYDRAEEFIASHKEKQPT